MPSRSHVPVPEEVRVVVEVIGGNRVNIAILRLAAIKPRTAAELAAELGTNHATVYRKLTALEEAGLIGADRPIGQRVGVTVHWSTNKDQVDRIFRSARAFALGEPDEATKAKALGRSDGSQ